MFSKMSSNNRFLCMFTGFTMVEQIPTPTFQFGGVTGSRETSLVFRKKTTTSISWGYHYYTVIMSQRKFVVFSAGKKVKFSSFIN